MFILKVVQHGKFVKHCKVEVYLVDFMLAENSRPDEAVKKKFSKTDTIGTIEKAMKEHFNIPDNVSTRLWTKYSSITYEMLTADSMSKKIPESSIYAGQLILIEQQKSDGTWERAAQNK
jgi:ubiquitin carboxyl-terminal hydrolase 4/11/15